MIPARCDRQGGTTTLEREPARDEEVAAGTNVSWSVTAGSEDSRGCLGSASETDNDDTVHVAELFNDDGVRLFLHGLEFDLGYGTNILVLK